MSEIDQHTVAHLQIVQAVISRMAANSFALKALAVSVTAGGLAVVGTAANPSSQLLLAALIPVGMFGLLDARYLRLEKLYRKLYDGVRQGEVDDPFTMDFSRYTSSVESHRQIAWTWSVGGFYGTLLAVLIALFLFLD